MCLPQKTRQSSVAGQRWQGTQGVQQALCLKPYTGTTKHGVSGAICPAFCSRMRSELRHCEGINPTSNHDRNCGYGYGVAVNPQSMRCATGVRTCKSLLGIMNADSEDSLSSSSPGVVLCTTSAGAFAGGFSAAAGGGGGAGALATGGSISAVPSACGKGRPAYRSPPELGCIFAASSIRGGSSTTGATYAFGCRRPWLDVSASTVAAAEGWPQSGTGASARTALQRAVTSMLRVVTSTLVATCARPCTTNCTCAPCLSGQAGVHVHPWQQRARDGAEGRHFVSPSPTRAVTRHKHREMHHANRDQQQGTDPLRKSATQRSGGAEAGQGQGEGAGRSGAPRRGQSRQAPRRGPCRCLRPGEEHSRV